MLQSFLQNFPKEFQDVITDSYDIILKRSLSRAYENLDEERKATMAKIFSSDDVQEKNNFLSQYMGNLNDIMLEEAEKLLAEIKE